MSRASCLLVGLGHVGMGYDLGTARGEQVMSHARALALSPDFEFIGAVDSSPEKRHMFLENYERPSYATLEQALTATSPRVVVIATPTETHLGVITETCLLSSPQVILCEKPLSYDLREAEEIIEICERAGVQLFVNYMRRVDPATNVMRQKLRSGSIGPFLRGSCFYSKGLIHNASHFINLLEYWFGKPTVADVAFSRSGGALPSDGLIDFALRFDKLQVDFRALGDIFGSPSSLEFWGPTSRLNYDWGGREIRTYDLASMANGGLPAELHSQTSSLPTIQGLVAGALAAVCRGQETNLCTGAAALGTLGVCIEILNKAKLAT